MWTKKGQLFVILGAASLFGGLFLSSMILIILGFLLLGMVIISAIIRVGNEIAAVKKGATAKDEGTFKGVKFIRRMSSKRLMEDGRTSVRLYMENPTRIAKRFELLDKAPDTTALIGGSNGATVTIPSKDGLWIDYQLECPIKGFYSLGPVKIRETDVCQFFYDEKNLDISTDFKVFPNEYDVKDVQMRSKIPKLYAGTTIINKPGQGTEFYSLREYVPGDPYRNINWPAYARTRRLMVNEHEMEAVIELTIILDYRGRTLGGEVMNNPHLASARAAASFANYFIKRRDKVGLAVYNKKVKYIHRDGGAKHLNRLLNHITGQEVKGDLGLAGAIKSMSHDLRKGMPVMIISTLEGDPTAYEGIKRLRALGCDVTLVAPTDLPGRLKEEKGEGKDDLKLRAIERKGRLDEIQSLGVRVADWDIRKPFTTIMGSALAGRWRQ